MFARRTDRPEGTLQAAFMFARRTDRQEGTLQAAFTFGHEGPATCRRGRSVHWGGARFASSSLERRARGSLVLLIRDQSRLIAAVVAHLDCAVHGFRAWPPKHARRQGRQGQVIGRKAEATDPCRRAKPLNPPQPATRTRRSLPTTPRRRGRPPQRRSPHALAPRCGRLGAPC